MTINKAEKAQQDGVLALLVMSTSGSISKKHSGNNLDRAAYYERDSYMLKSNPEHLADIPVFIIPKKTAEEFVRVLSVTG
jgi:hypothetical protein